MNFGRHARSRRVVVTAFARDRRIIRQWDLDLSAGQRVQIPAGTWVVQLDDPATIIRTRVELGRARLPRTAPGRRR